MTGKELAIQILTQLLSAASIVAVLGYLGKLAITRWSERQDDLFKHQLGIEKYQQQLRDETGLRHLESRLSEFYWPLYIRLQKDNVLWERVFGPAAAQDDEGKRLAMQLERDVLLPNHEAIATIIEQKIHLCAGDHALEATLLKYIRHVSVYKAIRQLGILDRDPKQFGEPWPEELFVAVEASTRRLQAEYDQLLLHATPHARNDRPAWK